MNRHGDPMPALLAAYRELRTAPDVGTLFAAGARLAVETAGFDRAVIATVAEGSISARESAVVAHAPSDRLRRRLVAAPVALRPRTEEAERVRRPTSGRPATRPSVLAETLELEHYVISPIAPDGATLALVVADRAGDPIEPADAELVDAFAAIVGMALDRVVLQRRVAELADEVRQFAGVAEALAREVRDAPLSLPSDHGLGSALPRPGLLGPAREEELAAVLTQQERRIAALLVEGRSNPEIAAALVLSRETVKTHVGHILRKLGAANRVEAASRLAPYVRS